MSLESSKQFIKKDSPALERQSTTLVPPAEQSIAEQATKTPPFELKEKQFEDFANSLYKSWNALNQVEVLDKNSFYELGVGLNNFKSLLEDGVANIDDFNKSLQLIDSGIQKIANIQGKMFTENDLEWTVTSVVALKETAEIANEIEAKKIDEQSSKLLLSISESAKRKSAGLSKLADAMEGYFSTQPNF